MRNKQREKLKHRQKLKRRIRKKISGTAERPRLVVYRGNSNVSVQLIDDVNNVSLGGITSVAAKYDDLKVKSSGKIEISTQIGKDLAELAKSIKINEIVFDRSGYQYHGRVKAIADGAREGGLKF